VHSDNSVAFIAPAAPTAFSADMAHARHQAIADGDDDDDDALFVPSTKYRDTQHVFANGPCDLVFNSESFSESSFFNKPGKTPVFVLENAPKKSHTEFASPFPFASSPLSPSSYSDKVDVPQKESCSYFCVNPSIPSRQSPTKIMDTLKAALLNFDCDFEVVKQWSIKVNLLCVAEEIAFTIELTRAADALSSSQDSYEIDFVRQFGDETKFVELAEYIRSLCSEIDDEALPFLSKSLEPWLDAKQEIAGRRHAIKEKEAASLIQELNAELHPDTLFEVTKMIKDHCRHKGNRKLFLQADHKNFLKGLKWMLTDCEEVARFGVFILLQFAKDQGVDGADECDLSLSSFFMSPYDKSSFALLLDEVLSRQQEAPCGKFTSAMVEQVQQSWVFA
jgi:hypothetical protein